MTRILVVAGDRAKKALTEGELDPKRLNDLGVCRQFDFDTDEEVRAFALAFNLVSKLNEPVMVSCE